MITNLISSRHAVEWILIMSISRLRSVYAVYRERVIAQDQARSRAFEWVIWYYLAHARM